MIYLKLESILKIHNHSYLFHSYNMSFILLSVYTLSSNIILLSKIINIAKTAYMSQNENQLVGYLNTLIGAHFRPKD